MSAISTQRVRELIYEELEKKKNWDGKCPSGKHGLDYYGQKCDLCAKNNLKEDVDHEGISDVVAAASKLLSAVKKFGESATGQMTHAVTPHLDKLRQVLEDMVQTPGSYVKVIPPKKKIVSLRAIQGEPK